MINQRPSQAEVLMTHLVDLRWPPGGQHDMAQVCGLG